MRFSLSVVALALPLIVFATPTDVSPAPESVIEDAKKLTVGFVTPLSATQVESYTPYSRFSDAADCPPETRTNWQCKTCQVDSVKGFQVYKYGGDGGVVQYWYVGWWPSQNSVVVGRQGTDPAKIEAVLTDAKFIPVAISEEQFPGRPASAKAHNGFLASHTRSAPDILSAVKDVLNHNRATKVLAVGHSLGGALAILDGLYLQLQLGSTVKVTIRALGAPRVGNNDFADFVNAKVSDVARLTVKRDIVPVLPPLLLGFKHTTGEKHLNTDNVWNSCAGQDNLSTDCSVGEVLTEGFKLSDHLGPYPGGVVIGKTGC
ncbi:alpha beta-hydrolase [Rhizoctonia solani]|nr:alpha beta-hydrolase [Rhizoctonia solani]